MRTALDAVAGVRTGQGAVMDWARILAYVTGTVDQELLGRNEYLAAGPAQNVVRPWNWFAEPRAARALPAQDGYLMSQGDEFEFQGEATTNAEQEQKEPRADRSVSMPMTV